MQEYDVCVIGGGPGGSTAATFVAMRGHRVLLIEKESSPVYKIGESLLPSTIHGICKMLDVSDEIRKQNFVRKLGGTFIWGKKKEPWTFAFAESPDFQGPTSYAYQVERIKFDAILLNNARRKGVEILEQHRAQELLLDDGRIAGVKLRDNTGKEKEIRTSYVVDASGHTSVFYRNAGERVYSTSFRNIAIFGYFRNGKRLQAPNAGNIFSVAFEKGWFWYIPLSETLTSVGAVIGQEYSHLLRQDHDALLGELISACPPIRALLSEATLCSDSPYNQIRVRKDYSYCNTGFWMPGLVLIGDAACFIDPVFSSGVHLATYSALLAARSINTFLNDPAREAAAFREFESRYRREYGYFVDFLTAFYDLDQDLASYYWTARTLMNAKEPGKKAFVRLVGGAASGDLLPRNDVPSRKSIMHANDLFPQATGKSTDIYSATGHQSVARAKFLAELNAEGFSLQLRGALRGSCPLERPMFQNGLVPSDDGLQWV
jgi:halogenation protein CepH